MATKRKPRARSKPAPAAPRRATAAPDLAAILKAGVAAQSAGVIGRARQAYLQALEIAPDNPDATHLLGVCHLQEGDHETAIRMISEVIARVPRFPGAHLNLGAAHFAAGHLEEAAECFRRAASLSPETVEAHSNLAATLADLGRIDEAIESYVTALRLSPGTRRFIKRLGDLYLANEQYGKVAELYERYLATAPDDAEVHNNLGYAYERLDRLEDAAREYGEAVALRPDSPEINNNVASALDRLGRGDEAQVYFARALEMDPVKWQDPANLAGSYANRNDTDRALKIFREQVEQRPNDAALLNDYGAVLGKASRTDEAIAVFQRAVEIDPGHRNARTNLGAALSSAHRSKEAIAVFKDVLARDPRSLAAHLHLCFALMAEQRLDEAYVYARATVTLPDYRPTNFTYPYRVFSAFCDFDAAAELGDPWDLVEGHPSRDQSADFLELLALADDEEKVRRLIRIHRNWAEETARALKGGREPLAPPGRYANRRIRLGFLSSDLRSHSVAKFVRPVFERYDRDRFEIYCYTPFEEQSDRVQHHLKDLVTAFRVVGNRSFLEIAEAIRADEIDILFELNGYTRDTKIQALMYRPAPVQMHWIGYSFTTGIPEIDYMPVDPYYRPVDDSFMTEKPLVLPDTLACFGTFSPEPIDDRLPCERDGRITFGTLNNPYKYSRRMIAAWAEIMHGVPGSRFLVVRPECRSVMFCANLTREFERHGIGRDRLYFVNNRATPFTHLTFYDEIDITLDTVPLSGGTTTCDALWMGVPVIALVGPASHQRLSYSILHNAGAAELCSEKIEDYVAKAIALAGDRASLRDYRMGLRPALMDSTLCRADRFVAQLQDALERVVADHGLR